MLLTLVIFSVCIRIIVNQTLNTLFIVVSRTTIIFEARYPFVVITLKNIHMQYSI